ncbi:MAG: hypothetical protein SFU86_07550 [Pirellulaceae bacterium]|nr:hypothetical protein [Pirellulaceae bacterium]
MIDPALRSEALALAEAIAPEVFDSALYLLDRAELTRPWPNDCLAYCGPTDKFSCDYLAAKNKWHGHGVLIAVDFTRFAEDHPENRRWAFLNLFLHELAHGVPAPPPRAETDDAEIAALLTRLESERYERAAAQAEKTMNETDSDHGFRFLRTVIHLWYRALTSGFFGHLDAIMGPMYGIASMARYVEALGDEPRRMFAETFGHIQATKPPAAFSALWTNELSRAKRSKQC